MRPKDIVNEEKIMTAEEIVKKEQELALREANLRQREIEATANESEYHKAMLDLKEQKLNHHVLLDELHQQKAVLIQLCKDIKDEHDF